MSPACAPQELVHVEFSPDKMCLALSCDNGMVALWRRGQTLVPLPTSSTTGIYAMAFDSSGSTLAAGGFEGAVYLWDLNSEQLSYTLPTTSIVTALCFSNDDRYLAVSSKDIELWDVKDVRRMGVIGRRAASGRRYEVLSFAPRDDCLAAISDRARDSLLHIWNVVPEETDR